MSRFVLAVHPGQRGTGFHDPAAAIFEDGTLRYGAEEERFVRIKHADGLFPERAIRACLDHCELVLSDLEEIVIPWDVPLRRKKIDPTFLLDTVKRETSIPGRTLTIAQYVYWNLFPESVTDSLREQFADIGEPVPDIRTRRHHRCHAASAFYPSGFENATVLTVDGEGEYDSTVVWRGTPDGLERVRTFKGYNSLGGLFGAVTEFLGFRAYNGEGKVMGLAPYGERDPDIESRLRSVIDVGSDYDVTAISAAGPAQGAKRLEGVLDRSRRTDADTASFTEWEKNLAATTQYLLEEIVTAIVREHLPPAGGNLALAGGVALNCKMNKRLLELDGVDDIFIQPVAHDAGTALGAGLLENEPGEVSKQDTVYFGSSYDESDIVDRLETNHIPFHRPDDTVRYVAEALAGGKLVGWFDGRFEMGPRALGARSILADPRSTDSRDRVNRLVKHREEWRPFAPSMLESAAEEYLENATTAPFMIRTFDVADGKADEIPAVLHPGDDTTRPQTVNADQNPQYHALISEFAEITGVPVVLNTSFNDKGEPIVNTPQDAIKDFYGMGLDMLVLGDIVVEKTPDRSSRS